MSFNRTRVPQILFIFFLAAATFSHTAFMKIASKPAPEIPLAPHVTVQDSPFYQDLLRLKEKEPLYEKSKILFLIDRVRRSPYRFQRNGAFYKGGRAAAHLMMKYRRKANYIHTAREFIDAVATRSSLTGEPYFIEIENGDLIPTRDLLLYELNRLEEHLKSRRPAPSPSS